MSCSPRNVLFTAFTLYESSGCYELHRAPLYHFSLKSSKIVLKNIANTENILHDIWEYIY